MLTQFSKIKKREEEIYPYSKGLYLARSYCLPLVAVLAGISFKLALACCRAQIHLAFIGTAIVAATAVTIALIAIKKPNKISSQEETVMTAG